MDLNKNYKVVYEESSITKILRGLLIAEDEFTITLSLENDKVVMIGKRYIQKATNIIEG